MIKKKMLKRALELRDKEEKYEEAGICLLKAAEEENNPEAMLHLHLAYKYGGWGFKKNLYLANEYMEKSVRAGFRLARIMKSYNVEGDLTPVEEAFMGFYFPHPHGRQHYDQFADLCITGENEFAQYLLTHYDIQNPSIQQIQILHKNARVCSYFGAYLCMNNYMITAKHYLYIAHYQKCFLNSANLVNILISEKNDLQAFKVAIEMENLDIIERVVHYNYRSEKLTYKIGKWLAIHCLNPPDRIVRKSINCISFYNFTIETSKSSIYTWSLCAKELGIYKDVTRLISRMVWKGKI